MERFVNVLSLTGKLELLNEIIFIRTTFLATCGKTCRSVEMRFTYNDAVCFIQQQRISALEQAVKQLQEKLEQAQSPVEEQRCEIKVNSSYLY